MNMPWILKHPTKAETLGHSNWENGLHTVQFSSKEEAEAWLIGQTIRYVDWPWAVMVPVFSAKEFRRLNPPCDLGCTHNEA